MSTSGWYCQEADEHGFVSLEHLADRARVASRDEFLRAFPRHCLRVDALDDGTVGPGVDQLLDPQDQGVQLLTVTIRNAGILRYVGKVAFVTKRPGNLYAHLISVGRSVTNDITLAIESISRVHGYFVADGSPSVPPAVGEGVQRAWGSGWSFIDHGSTNGSRLDGADLVAGRRYPLCDGSQLQLGPGISLELLSPESLYRLVKTRDEPGMPG